MEADHNTKCNKYRDVPGLANLVKSKCGTHSVEFHALTISFKGVLEQKTSKFLQKMGISENFKFMMITSVLRGAWLNWRAFNRITTVTR